MDQRTLEYMGERVDKARLIQKQIKDLEYFIEYGERRGNIKLYDHHGNGPRIERRDFIRLAENAKTAIIDAVHEEIDLLKAEPAEI